MQVFVKTLSGQTVTVDCEPSDTVFEFKQKVSETTGHSAWSQRMIFAGKGMEDTKLLADYHISKQSTVHMVLVLKGGMMVYVKALTGVKYEIECEPSDNFLELKQKLEETTLIGWQTHYMRLIYKGKLCQDTQTLHEMGIVGKDLIHVVMRCGPG